MTLEHHPDAIDDVHRIHRGQADVPLKTVEQCTQPQTAMTGSSTI
jgi:hypothetical protein